MLHSARHSRLFNSHYLPTEVPAVPACSCLGWSAGREERGQEVSAAKRAGSRLPSAGGRGGLPLPECLHQAESGSPALPPPPCHRLPARRGLCGRLLWVRPLRSSGQNGALEVRDWHKDIRGGQAQRESIIGVIIILPAPIIDPFPAWKPPIYLVLCLYHLWHKDRWLPVTERIYHKRWHQQYNRFFLCLPTYHRVFMSISDLECSSLILRRVGGRWPTKVRRLSQRRSSRPNCQCSPLSFRDRNGAVQVTQPDDVVQTEIECSHFGRAWWLS